ncbi:MAG: 3'(2'),5'-bisphosphate nucleotidase CysQ [Nitrospirae bacterium]|nr:3'(2'),5'-bisphosphate nucleotidase CysQ [Nitrospirota bacterium]
MDRTSCIDSLTADLGTLLRLLREAGKKVLSVYREDFMVVLKPDDSPLTLADSESHDLLVTGLPEILPVPVLSEEGREIPSSERESWRAFWSIDPLDGTREFVRRSGEFCISVALVLGRIPIFGLIYIPVEDRIYFGGEGVGSYRLDGAKFDGILGKGGEEALSSCDRLDPARDGWGARPWVMLGSVSHHSEIPADLREALSMKETFHLHSVGSAIKFCRVAEGRADFYPRYGTTMEWDTAAGQAIVCGVGGGVVEAGTKRPLLYNKPALENPDFYCFGPRFRSRFPEIAGETGK